MGVRLVQYVAVLRWRDNPLLLTERGGGDRATERERERHTDRATERERERESGVCLRTADTGAEVVTSY